MDLSYIIKKPLITEKSLALAALGKYTFVVDKKTDKNKVKEAVEKFFKVNVKKTWLINYKGKNKKVGRQKNKISKKPDWKKAIVLLAKGQKIDLFETGSKS